MNFNLRTVYHLSLCEVLYQNSYLFQSYLKNFLGCNFQNCCLAGLCFAVNFCEKLPILYLGSKIYISSTQLLAKIQPYRKRGYLIFFFYYLSSLSSQAIEFVCLYKRA